MSRYFPAAITLSIALSLFIVAGWNEQVHAVDTLKGTPRESPQKLSPEDDELGNLRISPNASKSEVREFVNKVMMASKVTDSYMHDAVEVDLFASVGRNNIDVLIESMDSRLRHLIAWAIIKVATEQDKQLIISALPEHHDLFTVILNENWLEDAKPVLVEEFKKARSCSLSFSWFWNVANWRIPDTYDHLVRYMVNCDSPIRLELYRTLAKIEGLELEAAVKEGWERAKSDPDSMKAFAAAAIEYGIADSLPVVISQVSDQKVEPEVNQAGVVKRIVWRSSEYDPRKLLSEYTTAPLGSKAEIELWYEKHKDHLVFDRELRRFVSTQES